LIDGEYCNRPVTSNSGSVVTQIGLPSAGNEGDENKDDEVTLPTRQEFNDNVAQGYSNYPPLEKMKPGIRVAETAFGLFLFISGGMVIALGGVIMAISVVELGGGTLTGPAAPLVFAHAGAGLAIGGIMATSGIFIITSGAYMIIVGVTGKNP
jgi:hypothetical protein